MKTIAMVLNIECSTSLQANSACYNLAKNLLDTIHIATVEPQFAGDIKHSELQSLRVNYEDQTSLAVIFLKVLLPNIDEMHVVTHCYKELLLLIQQNLTGNLLALAVMVLADILKHSPRLIGISDAIGSTALLSSVQDILFSVEQQVVNDFCDVIKYCGKLKEPNNAIKTKLRSITNRACGVCYGISALGKAFIEFGVIAELEQRCGALIDRFITTLIEILPLTEAKNEPCIVDYTIEITAAFLETIAVYMDGLFASQYEESGQHQGLSSGKLTKYIRLWLAILICCSKIHALPPDENALSPFIIHLAQITPPLVFDKCLNTSKSTDLADELIDNDSSLVALMKRCIFSADKQWLNTMFAAHSSFGLTTSSYFLMNATQLLESFRSKYAFDIRPLVGYIADLSNWASDHKR